VILAFLRLNTHPATIVSFDRDFARFEGVALRHPGRPVGPISQ